jgi:hypothetical protein
MAAMKLRRRLSSRRERLLPISRGVGSTSGKPANTSDAVGQVSIDTSVSER